MKNSLSRIEFWLMDSCLHHAEAIDALAKDADGYLGWFGKVKPTENLTEITQALNSLFNNGDLSAVVREKGCGSNRSEHIPTRREIDSQLLRESGRLDLWYLLTPRGGARWEEAANTDWTKFISGGPRPLDDPCVNFSYTRPINFLRVVKN